MKKFLIVVDMQNDFVDGSLGSEHAQAIVKNVVDEINSFDGEIIATFDTHYDDYLDTAEGKKLPVKHCIKGTYGFELNPFVKQALDKKGFTPIEKLTFGSTQLPQLIKTKANNEEFSIELVGLCTDICVVSNALILKSNFPFADICVKESCCAGVTVDTHCSALDTMRMCHIDII